MAVAAASWIEEAAARLGGIDLPYNIAVRRNDARPVAARDARRAGHHRPAWKHLCDGGGSVINVSSISALRGVAPLGDAAYMAVYLASDESTWVTGETYSVDGGWSMGFR